MSSSMDTSEHQRWSLDSQIISVRVHGKEHPRESSPNRTEEEEDPGHCEGRSLFVGDLSENATEQDLHELFCQAGEVDNVDVKKDRMTGASRGFGFVSFKQPSAAKKAIQLFHRANLKGRPIRIGWAQKNAKVFVGILPDEFTPTALAALMEQFGPIQHGQTRIENHFGFVEYLYRNHAERARTVLDGAALTVTLSNGRQTRLAVRLGWADEQTQKNCVHVQFNAEQAHKAQIDKQDLLLMFCPFGDIFSVIIPRYSNEKMKGYGFVHYADSPEGEISSAKAILALDGADIRGVRWSCNFGKQKRERGRSRSQINRKTDQQPESQQQIHVQFESTFDRTANPVLQRPVTPALALHPSHLPSFEDFLVQHTQHAPYYPHSSTMPRFDNQLRDFTLSPWELPHPGGLLSPPSPDAYFPFFSPSPGFDFSRPNYYPATHTTLRYIPPRD